MKSNPLLSAFFCLLILSSSCKKAVKTKAELVTYINDPGNKLQISDNVGQVETSLTYKPWQLMVRNQQKAKTLYSKAVVNNLRNKYFFVLSLSTNHKELLRQLKFSDYSEMVQVMAFRMGEYVSALPDHGKAVVPDECVFQQTYGMGTANQLLIVFDRSKFENAKQIAIRIKEFGLGIGNLNYQFNLKDIDDLKNIAL